MSLNQEKSKDWRDNDPDKETAERWKNDPNNWIWGFLYYNKEDKRILPPKKNDWMGFTINFANPKSILSLILFILFFISVSFMITRK